MTLRHETFVGRFEVLDNDIIEYRTRGAEFQADALLRIQHEIQALKRQAVVLVTALKDVQAAMAMDRDGMSYTHPLHGDIDLEEIKFLVVDEALVATGHA